MKKILSFVLAAALGAALGTGIDQAYSAVTTTAAANPSAMYVSGSTVYATEDNVAAFAGGGQGSATQLSSTASFHRVSTVASAGDSVKLPAATGPGLWHCVKNAAAGSVAMSVFPQTGENINATAANTAMSVVRANGMCFFSTVAGNWQSVSPQLAGTTNQVNIAFGTLGLTFSTPQNIDTAAQIQFNSIGLGVAASATAGTLTGPATTGVQHAGTATNDSASAGQAGEYQEVNCGIPAASGASVAFTSASPTVGTWTAHPFQKTGVAFGSYACPFTITATAPTGLSTATNYWAVPIDANTFNVATSAANAAAGTFANTSGSTSTSNLTNSISLSTTAGLSPAVVKLTAGDWDCSGQAIRVLGATTSVTNMQTGINSASTTVGSFGTYFDFETAANIMTATSNPIHSTPTVRISLASTTAEYLIALDTFTASTNTVSGFLRCRRMR